jgi:ABC-type phosphate transport system substrate-binding protein
MRDILNHFTIQTNEIRLGSLLSWPIVALAFIAFSFPAAEAQDVLFVVNKEVHISEIKASDLRAIFTGEKTRFADGTHAVPVLLKGGPVHEVFVENYCGESPNEFRAQWRKAVFTGQGSMPKAFDSEAALLSYVAETPGAIGYVSRITPNGNVKQLIALK